jgi:hypothetical protein
MGKFDKIPVVREIKHILAHEAARYFISACLVEGKLKATDHIFRCLFTGKSYFTKRLEDQMYAEPPKVLWKRRLYIPALKARIQSNPDSEFFQKGFLLFVTKDGQDLAGNLCLVEDNVLMLRRAGVLDGDESYVEAGAQTALYYFGLKYANEQGLHAADAMMSASFLNDGVYVTKKEWGAVVSPSDDFNTWVYLFNLGSADKLAQFYDQNPFIAQTDSGLKGLLGAPTDASSTPEALEPLLRQYRSEGLTSFIVHTPAGIIEVS